jgi:hypothetical protein
MSEQKEALGRPWSLLRTEATQVSPMGKGYIELTVRTTQRAASCCLFPA